MRMIVKKLLKRHKYPPEGMDYAVQTVLAQCELWSDNTFEEAAAPVTKLYPDIVPAATLHAAASSPDYQANAYPDLKK